VNRTDLLTAALSKLSDAVALLSDAGEERLAAQLEDIIHQISLLEDMPPNSQTKSTWNLDLGEAADHPNHGDTSVTRHRGQ
jgi:hypothetical protein